MAYQVRQLLKFSMCHLVLDGFKFVYHSTANTVVGQNMEKCGRSDGAGVERARYHEAVQLVDEDLARDRRLGGRLAR